MTDHVHGYRFNALGCTGRIRITGLSRGCADSAVADAVCWLRHVEKKLSRFESESLVAALNRGEVVPADIDLCAVLQAGIKARHLSAGRLSLLAAPLWHLWHDPARTSWPDVECVTEALQCCGRVEVTNTVRLRGDNAQIDLGLVGKEWCVDHLLQRLIAHGCCNALVELGGDCAAHGQQPDRDGWVVLVPGVAAAVVLHNEALATSGHGTRGRILDGQWVSHVIDAASGQPARGVVQRATVLANNCLTAGIHASDLSLLESITPVTCAARSGGLPYWLMSSSNAICADPEFLARIHPVAHSRQRKSA